MDIKEIQKRNGWPSHWYIGVIKGTIKVHEQIKKEKSLWYKIKRLFKR